MLAGVQRHLNVCRTHLQVSRHLLVDNSGHLLTPLDTQSTSGHTGLAYLYLPQHISRHLCLVTCMDTLLSTLILRTVRYIITWFLHPLPFTTHSLNFCENSKEKENFKFCKCENSEIVINVNNNFVVKWICTSCVIYMQYIVGTFYLWWVSYIYTCNFLNHSKIFMWMLILYRGIGWDLKHFNEKEFFSWDSILDGSWSECRIMDVALWVALGGGGGRYFL